MREPLNNRQDWGWVERRKAPQQTNPSITGSKAGVIGAGVTGAEVTGAGVTWAGVIAVGVTGAEVTGAGVTGAGVTGAGDIGACVIGAAIIGAGVTGANKVRCHWGWSNRDRCIGTALTFRKASGIWHLASGIRHQGIDD
jgi:hypothetical protein